jgi:hypothetical protein
MKLNGDLCSWIHTRSSHTYSNPFGTSRALLIKSFAAHPRPQRAFGKLRAASFARSKFSSKSCGKKTTFGSTLRWGSQPTVLFCSCPLAWGYQVLDFASVAKVGSIPGSREECDSNVFFCFLGCVRVPIFEFQLKNLSQLLIIKNSQIQTRSLVGSVVPLAHGRRHLTYTSQRLELHR